MIIIQIALGIVLGVVLLALLPYILSGTDRLLAGSGKVLTLMASLFRVTLLVILWSGICLCAAYPMSKLFPLLPSNMQITFVYVVLIALFGCALLYLGKFMREFIERKKQR